MELMLFSDFRREPGDQLIDRVAHGKKCGLQNIVNINDRFGDDTYPNISVIENFMISILTLDWGKFFRIKNLILEFKSFERDRRCNDWSGQRTSAGFINTDNEGKAVLLSLFFKF